MSRFINHINEAFSASDLKKTIKNIKSVVERQVGGKLLPFGKGQPEPFKRSNGLSGFGVWYLVDSQNMVIRFNWEAKKKSNTLTSIDAWTDLNNLFVKPDYTLDIPKDYNIVQAIGIVTNFIKKPKAGIIEEGKKMSIEDRLGIEEAKGDVKRALALQWGLDPELTYAEVQKAVRKKKRLQSLKGVPENNTMVADAKAAQKALDKQKYADPDTIFEDLDDLVRMVAGNIQPSLLVTGMAGIGKTYSVTKVLKDMLGSEGGKWVHIKGKLSPVGMYRAFFANRNKLIVFDDADSVFANQDTVNMLKAALDSYETRTISWFSPLTVDVTRLDKEQIDELYDNIESALSTDPGNAKIKFPNRFDFKGQVIFISNLAASKIDSAVKSRSLTIDVTLERQSVIKRLQSILPHIGGDVSMDEKQVVLDYLKESYKGELNIRSFILGVRCKQSGSANWQRLIAYA